jgi:hypothetical protein
VPDGRAVAGDHDDGWQQEQYQESCGSHPEQVHVLVAQALEDDDRRFVVRVLHGNRVLWIHKTKPINQAKRCLTKENNFSSRVGL